VAREVGEEGIRMMRRVRIVGATRREREEAEEANITGILMTQRTPAQRGASGIK
jgi:hypothetical protein